MLKCDRQRAQKMKKKLTLIKRNKRDWAGIEEKTEDIDLPSTTTNLVAMARQNLSNPKLGHYIKKANKNDCSDLIKEYCNNFLLEMETH